jgi:hypothetical protein
LLGKGKGFLELGFLTREAPHSEAFFTSVIQTVSGIRYNDAGFSLWLELDFLPKPLKNLFIAPFLSRSSFDLFPEKVSAF